MKVPVPPSSLRVFLLNAKVVWKQWNVQSMVLTSFSIQLILILLVPFRKQSSNAVLIASVWLSYLLADWVAIQSIGLISNPCGSTTTTTATSDADNELYAFWAQFLLLHLGGPDTITALALEDSELWLRTGLHLGVQIYGSLGILVKSAGHSQSGLWVPTLLIFIAGIIKYTERVSSLFHGRLLRFSNHQLDRVSRKKLNRLEPDDCHGSYAGPASTEEKTDADLVRDAFYFFHDYKALYAGQQFRYAHREFSCRYLCKRTAEEAFRLLEIQFNLAYEVFYTKTVLICTKLQWKVLRFVVTLLQVGCLVIWLLFTNKDGLKDYNIRITYTLLVGAIAVDVFAFLRIQLWSDWTIAQANKRDPNPSKKSFHNMILSARRRTWGRYKNREDAPMWACFRRALFRRWSESIPQLSLLSLCLSERSNKVIEFFGVGDGIEQRKYVSKKWFSNQLRDFIFEDLKEKVRTRGGLENMGRVKGGWACVCLMSNYQAEMISIPYVRKLLDVRGEYDMVLMRWCIITELCYHGDHLSHDADDNLVNRLINKLLPKGNKPNNNAGTKTTENKNLNEGECTYREICKTLSDYLMYLLIHQQDMMSLPARYLQKAEEKATKASGK